MLAAFLASLATGLATTFGALPFLWLRISQRRYDILLGFGAGLMLAAATLGLLSSALAGVRRNGEVDVAALILVVAGFAVGVTILHLMDRCIPHVHAGGHHVHLCGQEVHRPSEAELRQHAGGTTEGSARKQGLLIVGVMSLHRIPEGFAIGAGYALGQGLGATLAVAIALQNVVEGTVMAAPLQRGGLRGSTLIALIIATGMAVPLAALAGYFLSLHIAGALPPLLALAAGALIYLISNEVIPESHSHGNEVPATFGVLTGFMFIMLLQVFTGH